MSNPDDKRSIPVGGEGTNNAYEREAQERFRQQLYKDVFAAGGLIAVVNEALRSSGSPLASEGLKDWKEAPFAYARVEHQKRFSQIYMAGSSSG